MLNSGPFKSFLFTFSYFGRWCEFVPPETLLVPPPLELPKACRGKMVSNRIQRRKLWSCPKTGIKVIVVGFFFVFVFFSPLVFFSAALLIQILLLSFPVFSPFKFDFDIHPLHFLFLCCFYSDSYERMCAPCTGLLKKMFSSLSRFLIVDWNKRFFALFQVI